MNNKNFSYTIAEALRGLVKNRFMSVASVLTLASCLFMFSASFCIVANLNYLLYQVEGMMSIVVFLDNDISTEDLDSLLEQVYEIPHITEISFVSSQQALEQFREGLDESAHMLDGLEMDNPLQASLELDIDNINNWDTVEGYLYEIDGGVIEINQNGRSTAVALTAINNVLRVISSMIIIGLGIISMVIILNTIRIAVNNRRIEINIMKYVGATDAFIRGPFIMEGLIIGLLGALVPLGIIYMLYGPAMDVLNERLPVMDFYFRSHTDILQLLSPLLLIIGILIGIMGSSISIRRYLNV